METLEIDSGPLIAGRPDGLRAFKGIPYAAPPIGPLRWRAPAPVAPWREPRRTDAFGPSSVQGVVWDDIDLRAGVSEDCLYLNVWTAAAPGERRAVLFWIHGGGFVAGSGAEPRYDGARLAARGLIVVTVNHRLNALGFLAHPELSAENGGASGNWGLADLAAALEWVQRNIAAFGGDPAQVAIAGESAGSMAVSALMASPVARGLFARAIGQSGALFSGVAEPLPSLAQAEARGLAFQRALGASSLAAMRAAPAAAVLAAAPGLGFRPVIDGRLLPSSLDASFAAGAQADVPLLAGWTQDEGFNFTLTPDGAGYEAAVAERFGAAAAKILAHYPGGAEAKASAAALGGDLVIVNKTWAWIEAQKATGKAPLYRYRFDRAPPVRPGWFGPRDEAQAGAFHAGDIPYMLDTLDAMPWDYEDADRATAAAASGYWLNFVNTGDPNGPDLPRWRDFRDSGEVMHIDATCRAAPEEGRERQAYLRGLAR
jgi:para-nitrobenzyl esterase